MQIVDSIREQVLQAKALEKGLCVYHNADTRAARMKRTKSSRARAQVVWDEVNLGEIEANKPPRQKIDEPKTPYHAVEYEDDEGTALDYASHAEAIQFASSRSERGRIGCGLTTYGDEAEDMERDEEGRRVQQIQKALHNTKITLICIFVIVLVLRGTIGAGNSNTLEQDFAKIRQHLSVGPQGEPHRVLVEVTKRKSKKKRCQERPRCRVLHAVVQQSMVRSREAGRRGCKSHLSEADNLLKYQVTTSVLRSEMVRLRVQKTISMLNIVLIAPDEAVEPREEDEDIETPREQMPQKREVKRQRSGAEEQQREHANKAEKASHSTTKQSDTEEKRWNEQHTYYRERKF
eukprot:Gb_40280 [translate_table: standard]